MIKKALLSLGIFTALVVAFAYLAGVSKMDVTIKHAMQRHVVAEPFEAGDVIEVSPDGQRIMSLLCKADLAPESRSSALVNSVYYNVVDHSQHQFMAFVRRSRGVLRRRTGAGRDQRCRPLRVEFQWRSKSGRRRDERAAPVLLHLRHRQGDDRTRSKACVVEKSLVETRLDEAADGRAVVRKTVGISFRDRPLAFNNMEALATMCPDLNTGAVVPTGQSCGGTSGYSLDVVARARIGLIREETLN